MYTIENLDQYIYSTTLEVVQRKFLDSHIKKQMKYRIPKEKKRETEP